MDITGHATSCDETGPVRGTLTWYDARGNRFHIWTVRDPNGVWRIEVGTRAPLGTIYKRAHDDPTGAKVRRLRADAFGHIKTVAYVLEQQNAHHIIEDDQREQDHRAAKATEEANAGHAEFMRGALRKFAATLTGDDTPHAALFEAMAERLGVEQLNRLSAIIHDIT